MIAQVAPRSILYESLREAAKEMKGPWLRRVAHAEILQRHYRPILEEEGLWRPVSSENWLASWREGGESIASWLDESTLGWHAEEGWGNDPWTDQIRQLRRPWYRRAIKLRNALARGLEAPVAWVAVVLWRKRS